MQERLDRVFPAESSGITQARLGITLLVEELGLTRERIDEVRLAVTEACTCVVRAASPESIFTLRAMLDEGHLDVAVQAHSPSRPGFPNTLGLSVIRKCATVVAVSSERGGRLQIEMRFRADRAQVPALQA